MSLPSADRVPPRARVVLVVSAREAPDRCGCSDIDVGKISSRAEAIERGTRERLVNGLQLGNRE